MGQQQNDYVSLLNSFKKSNKERKLKMAQKAGYNTVEEYLAFLTMKVAGKQIKPPTKTPAKKAAPVKKLNSDVRPTIHVVDIIDCSGSMSGNKIANAVRGINDNLSKLKEDKSAVDYTYTLCDFSGNTDINFKYVAKGLDQVTSIYFSSRGATALRDAIGNTLHKLREIKRPEDKVLVNIYTDGEENDSTRYNNKTIQSLIESLKGEGFTITFVGTNQDVNKVQKLFSIEESNTLAYDGSAEGLSKTIGATAIARAAYFSKVASGQDVTKGFYKEIKKF